MKSERTKSERDAANKRDIALCDRVKDGDNGAAVELIEQYRGFITDRSTWFAEDDPQRYEELVVACEAAVWRSAMTYDPSHGAGATFCSYVCRSVINACRTVLRARGTYTSRNVTNRSVDDELTGTAIEHTVDYRVERQQEAEAVADFAAEQMDELRDLVHTAGLTEDQADVLQSMMQGESTSEIMERRGTTRQGVNMLYQAAKSRIQYYLQHGVPQVTKVVHEIDGVSKTLSQWCEEYGKVYSTTVSRMSRGMGLEEALNYEREPAKVSPVLFPRKSTQYARKHAEDMLRDSAELSHVQLSDKYRCSLAAVHRILAETRQQLQTV